MTTVIDTHNHFYPDTYLDALNGVSGNIGVSEDEDGRRVIVSGGSRIVTMTPPMTDLDRRIRDMDRAGVDKQLLSLTAPNVNFVDGEESIALAQTCNDAYAEIVNEHDRFEALASVPLREPEAAIAEAERAITELDLNGFIVGSNIDGTPLDDPSFESFYETVADLDVPLFIHPMTPAGVEVMQEYRLAPLVGFENEITMAITRLIFDGVLERYDLDVHLAHLGGTVPYLTERLNNGYRAYPECRENIDSLPGAYLEDVFYDTVSFHDPALHCALETVGADQVIMGTDYPHVIGDIDRGVESLDGLKLSADERDGILGGNAATLYDF